MSTFIAKVVRARKGHQCYRCLERIPAGDVYTRHTMLPGSDREFGDKPDRVAECMDCRRLLGRA